MSSENEVSQLRSPVPVYDTHTFFQELASDSIPLAGGGGGMDKGGEGMHGMKRLFTCRFACLRQLCELPPPPPDHVNSNCLSLPAPLLPLLVVFWCPLMSGHAADVRNHSFSTALLDTVWHLKDVVDTRNRTLEANIKQYRGQIVCLTRQAGVLGRQGQALRNIAERAEVTTKDVQCQLNNLEQAKVATEQQLQGAKHEMEVLGLKVATPKDQQPEAPGLEPLCCIEDVSDALVCAIHDVASTPPARTSVGGCAEDVLDKIVQLVEQNKFLQIPQLMQRL